MFLVLKRKIQEPGFVLTADTGEHADGGIVAHARCTECVC